jgi:hypothetical protein
MRDLMPGLVWLISILVPISIDRWKFRGAWLGAVAPFAFGWWWHPFGEVRVRFPHVLPATPALPMLNSPAQETIDLSYYVDISPAIDSAVFTVLGIVLTAFLPRLVPVDQTPASGTEPQSPPDAEAPANAAPNDDAPHTDVPDQAGDKPQSD